MSGKTDKTDPGVCDNHPGEPAVHVTDGKTHEVQRFCKGCLAKLERALRGPRRG